MKRSAPRITKKRLVFVGVGVLFLGYFVLPSTIDLLRLRGQVAPILKHARAIRLEECQGRRYRQVLSSVELKRGDIGNALGALHYAPDLSCPGVEKMCAFPPHHRIVAVAEDGVTMNLEICFTCGDLALKSGADSRAPVVAIPFVWRPLLRRFFTSHGIPVRDGYNDFDFATPN